MFYNVIISQKSNKSYDEVKMDLTEEEVKTRFIEPYENGESLFINGKTIPITDLDRIRITTNNSPSKEIIKQIEYEDMQSSIAVLGGPTDEWRAADRGKDVTDNYIQGAPGYKKKEKKNEKFVKNVNSSEFSKTKVFIVHGHDINLKNDLEIFLREIKLDPIVLHRQPDEGLTVIEKFERYSDVGFAFILLTPDDIAFSSSKLKLPDNERELEYRARQNVIFEFGYFAAKLGRPRVCCLYKEGTKLPSDLSGLLYKKISSSIEEIGYALIKELQHAGLKPEV